MQNFEKNIIQSYCLKYKISDNFLHNLCEDINKKKEWVKHSYASYDEKTNSLKNATSGKEFDISSYSNDTEIGKEFFSIIWNILGSYCRDISQIMECDEFIGWHGFTAPRINKYEENTIMTEHHDHIHTIFDGERKGIPTFTVLGLLQNAEEGGEFVMWGDTVLDVVPGDVLVFPSNFLYRHKVNEIIKGTRISFVSWAWG